MPTMPSQSPVRSVAATIAERIEVDNSVNLLLIAISAAAGMLILVIILSIVLVILLLVTRKRKVKRGEYSQIYYQ